MKKRILSALLAPALLFSAAVPGLAAERGDSAERLAAVTEKVKAALALDTEQYQSFNGQLTEGELVPTWRLNWSGEDSSLEITASETGRILSYYYYDGEDSWDTTPLSLPKGDPAKAKEAAAAFLGRVLDASETVDLDAAAGSSSSLRQTRYSFRGTLLLNGCASPLSFSLSVRALDNAVVQFRRDSLETGYTGAVPAASFRTAQGTAEALLRDTLSLRTEYVLDAGEKTAVLRYLPNRIDSFYVDDASGKLVNLTQLYENLGTEDYISDTSAAESGSPAAANGGGLTQAEQLGADKLKDTLGKEALDQKARAISQLGLNSYTLASVSYQEEELVKDAPVIVARLAYAKRVDEQTFRRWVTLNATTGELISVYSSGLWVEDEDPKVSEEAARKAAEDFLSGQQGERFAQCASHTSDSPSYRENGRYGTWAFCYARQVNGYFFPNDQFTVGIDTTDGSVTTYSQTWSEDVSFDSPDGVIPAEQAVDAYFKAFQLTRGYVAVPQKLSLSDPDYAPLVEMGYRALNSLKLGWQLAEPERSVRGIDAKTGQPVLWTSASDSALGYDDLDGSWAKSAIETLAGYNIGYAGGKFRPDKALSQLDLVALVASTQGVLVDPDNLSEEEAGRAYQAVYDMGALKREDRDDSRTLSRIETIQLLLDAGGYGPVAQLQGIYKTSFSDEGSIPEELLGYAALAQAMQVAHGDGSGQLNPTQPATRQDAAAMLLAFMRRG